MYKLLIYSLLILFPSRIYAQNNSVGPAVIASAGTRFQNNNMIIDWTLGELSIATLQGSSNVISQGFHQPRFVITTIEELPQLTGKITVYPNPASDLVRIEIMLDKATSVRAGLYDSNGNLLWNDEFYGQKITKSTSLKNYPQGNYFLKLVPDGYKSAQTFKIQKID